MVNRRVYLNKNFVSNCVIFKMTKILESSSDFKHSKVCIVCVCIYTICVCVYTHTHTHTHIYIYFTKREISGITSKIEIECISSMLVEREKWDEGGKIQYLNHSKKRH